MSDPITDAAKALDDLAQVKYQDLIENNKLLQRQLELANDEFEKQNIVLRVQAQVFKEITDAKIKDIKAGEASVFTAKQLKDIQRQQLDQTREEIELNRLNQEERKKQQAELEKLNAKYEGLAKNLVQATTGMKKFSDTALGMALAEPTLLLSKMREQIDLVGAGYSLIEKVVQSSVSLMLAQDEMISSFRRATGAGQEYNDLLTGSEITLRTYGVDLQDVSDASLALFENTSKFTKMSREAQKELIGTTALLSRFGISSDTATANTDTLTKALGMSASQAATTSRDLFALGQAIGVPPAIIMKDFGPAMSDLAAHGDDAIRVFKGMAAAAKETGLEMGELMSIATRFDTFEDAAETVGGLNALLGGPYLNSLEMMKASHEERIALLIGALETSGKVFSEMEYFEQKAIAARVGITDLAAANKIFSTSTEELAIAQMKAQDAAMSQKELEEASRGVMTLVEKGKKIMQGFAISLAGLIPYISATADAFLSLQESTNGAFGVYVLITGAALMLAGTLGTIILNLASMFASLVANTAALLGFSTSTNTASVSAVTLNLSSKGLAKTLKRATPAIAAAGVSALKMGAAVALAAAGMAGLFYIVGQIPFERLLAAGAAFVGLAVGVKILIPALTALSGASEGLLPALAVLAALSAVAVVLGGATYLAGEGLKLVGEGLTQIFNTIAGSPEAILFMYGLSGAIAAVGIAVMGFGPQILLAASAFAVLALAIKSTIDSLELEKLQALATIMEVLGGTSGGGVTVVPPAGGSTPVSQVERVVGAVNDLNAGKAAQAEKVIKAAAPTVSNAAPAAQSGVKLGPLATAKNVQIVLNDQIVGKIVRSMVNEGLMAKLVSS